MFPPPDKSCQLNRPLLSEYGYGACSDLCSPFTPCAQFTKTMTAVLADLRELSRSLSAFTAFQLGHFCPRGIQVSMEKAISLAGESLGDADLVLIRAVLAHLLYTQI